MFGKLAYYSLKLRYVRHFELSNPAGVRNSFVQFGYDVSAFSLAHSQAFCSFTL